MLQTLPVDDSGEIWDGNCPRSGRGTASVASNDGLASYVVGNFGFISATATVPPSVCALRPAIVAPTALRTLLLGLRRTIDRALHSLLEEEWAHHIHGFLWQPLSEYNGAMLGPDATIAIAGRCAAFAAVAVSRPALDRVRKFAQETA
jgi:hypothetical protein